MFKGSCAGRKLQAGLFIHAAYENLETEVVLLLPVWSYLGCVEIQGPMF